MLFLYWYCFCFLWLCQEYKVLFKSTESMMIKLFELLYLLYSFFTSIYSVSYLNVFKTHTIFVLQNVRFSFHFHTKSGWRFSRSFCILLLSIFISLSLSLFLFSGNSICCIVFVFPPSNFYTKIIRKYFPQFIPFHEISFLSHSVFLSLSATTSPFLPIVYTSIV